MALMTEFRTTGRCPKCGTEGDVWFLSNLGTEGRKYVVGDDVSDDLTPDELRSGSFVVREPEEGTSTHVLMGWTCKTCLCGNFAEVVIDRGRVADIRPVRLSVAALDSLNYVEQAISDQIEAYTNHSMWDESGVWSLWLGTLREKLADDERVVCEQTSTEYFIKDATVDGGKFRLDEHYLGLGDDQLWFARSDAAPTLRYLVSLSPDNGLDLNKDGDGLLRAADGLFTPRFLGHVDVVGVGAAAVAHRGGTCAYVEELPRGVPLRKMCIDLSRHALDLGAQVGALLSRAHASGVLDVGVRPEYVWTLPEQDRLLVTGIGGRNRLFFGAARRRRDLVTARLFTHQYIAPEVYRGDLYDDRALTLTVAVMVAEWLVGKYPFAEGDGAWGYNRLYEGEHIELPGPPTLTDLLRRAMRPVAVERPDLATFTQALASLAASAK